ncbi:MAG: hypothetical protein SNJ79_04095 [Sphingomonadaceae bacterium]
MSSLLGLRTKEVTEPKMDKAAADNSRLDPEALAEVLDNISDPVGRQMLPVGRLLKIAIEQPQGSDANHFRLHKAGPLQQLGNTGARKKLGDRSNWPIELCECGRRIALHLVAAIVMDPTHSNAAPVRNTGETLGDLKELVPKPAMGSNDDQFAALSGRSASTSISRSSRLEGLA